jgi:lysophospholipase L1-like esterase
MKALKLLAPVALSFLIGLALCEVALRLIPNAAQYPPLYDYDYKDSLLGIEMFPNVVHTERTACFTSTITTNSAGWRDKERLIARVPGKTRIAVLGDSFMAGTQVNDNEVFAQQLEKILGPDKFEVLNFGLSSIGTEQEDILYEHVVSKYDPDVVLLAFYSNDAENSHPDIEGGPQHDTRLTYRDGSGGLVSFRKSTPFDGTRHWLRMHSATFRFVTLAYRTLRAPAAGTGGIAGYPAYPREYGVYEVPPSPLREESWQRVARAIVSLKSQIPAPKKLVAFSVPEILQTAPEYKQLIHDQYGVDPPAGFTPTYPAQRFAKIAADAGVPFIDLVPDFIAEQQKQQLKYPYFYHTCDGHWNALGHALAAEAMAEALRSPVAL